MSILRHWKMIVGLMAIFGTGVGTGGVGTLVVLHKVFTSPVATQRWTDSKLTDLEEKLKLTAEQKRRIRPIVEKAARRFREIGGEAFDKIIATAEQTHAEVAKELTPEQQPEFNRMRPKVIAALRELAQREISVKANDKKEKSATSPLPDLSVPAKVDAKRP